MQRVSISNILSTNVFSKSRYKRSYMMAKPNFNFVKRQKELEKKKKNEEKIQRKLANRNSGAAEEPEQPTDEGEAS
jgi:hypothetical protein